MLRIRYCKHIIYNDECRSNLVMVIISTIVIVVVVGIAVVAIIKVAVVV